MRTSFLVCASALTLCLSAGIRADPPRSEDAAGAPGGAPLELAFSPENLYREAPASSAAASSVETASPLVATQSPVGALGGLSAATAGASSAVGTASYLEARAGPFFFFNAFDNLNTGALVEGAFGVRPLPLLALEVTGGYLWGEETGSTVNESLWAVPIMGNAKVTLPLPLIQPYVGAGVGVFYLNTEERLTGADTHEADWVLGWNAMLGVSFEVGPLMVGVEGKYLQTDLAHTARGTDERLEGLAVLVAAGLKF